MKVPPPAASAAALFAALLCCSTAIAQPRASEETGGEPIPDAAMDEWLRRLVGNYKLDGSAGNSTGVKGKADCVAIGTGPGVHCILNAIWIDQYSLMGQPILIDYLDPAMMLLGMDPGRSAINMMLVNDKGLPEGTFGRIKGNTATFYSPCVNTPVFDSSAMRMREAAPIASESSDSSESESSAENSSGPPASSTSGFAGSNTPGGGTGCTNPVRIEAKADANIIYMWMEPYSVLLQLRRIRPDEGGAAPAKPEPQAIRTATQGRTDPAK